MCCTNVNRLRILGRFLVMKVFRRLLLGSVIKLILLGKILYFVDVLKLTSSGRSSIFVGLIFSLFIISVKVKLILFSIGLSFIS